jgi:16S rRNA (adenine1518-N6/adenine1519-N6)-dimethyltransferase
MSTQGRRRALGQHFLKDRSIAQKIAQTALSEARLHSCRTLLEIGPGRGAITDPLLADIRDRGGIDRFLICEKDLALFNHWKQEEQESPFVTSTNEDFLDWDSSEWLKNTPIAVVSNLPYSAGTAILVRLARHPAEIPVMTLMFQAEVAQRLRAKPESKAWGSLSVWLQNQWDVTSLLHVPPHAFAPPPDVQSEVVVLRRREKPRVEIAPTEKGQKLWDGLLKACFAHRRKMLRSGLAGAQPYRNALDVAKVDGTKRAEALNWEEWDRLYQAVIQLTV